MNILSFVSVPVAAEIEIVKIHSRGKGANIHSAQVDVQDKWPARLPYIGTRLNGKGKYISVNIF